MVNNNKKISGSMRDNFVKKKASIFKNWHILALYLILYDMIAIATSYFFTLLFRFDFAYSSIPKEYLDIYLKSMCWLLPISLILFWILKLYKSIWSYAGYTEFIRVIMAIVLTSLINCLGILVLYDSMPISYYIIGPLLLGMFMLGIRFLYRFIKVLKKHLSRNNSGVFQKAMIIGAGNAGQMVIKELFRAVDAGIEPVCAIDDDPNKEGRYVEGIPVVGGRASILYNAKKYEVDQILFAIPTASTETKRDILNICNETGCKLKSLPSVAQLVTGAVKIGNMKDVAIEDLLGRPPIQVNMPEIYNQIKGKTILVTGGGGSIGSELCRQIAKHDPRQLIVFDIYENNAYSIEQELREKYINLNLIVLIGSVRDSRRLDMVFSKYKPDVVFHAAAHKHVPLMETSPNEAIKNNSIGTFKTAYCALKYGARRFVLISTDKAVNPTSVMGASKRLCEMIIQSIDMISREKKYELLPDICGHLEEESETFFEKEVNKNFNGHRTEFVAVRFGNVLGSNGSVVPLFKKQIEKGGPVTVTHPDIIRYFMTIPEAVSLVIQAAVYARGGEIFVLDMGAPVKIDDLARNLIKLSGLKPDADIKIVYTGLRPGEKLYEEKLMKEEGLITTPNKLIHVGKPIDFDMQSFFDKLVVLAKRSYNNVDNIEEEIKKIISSYHAPEEDLAINGETYAKQCAEAAATKEE